jgi:hypothetical protein
MSGGVWLAISRFIRGSAFITAVAISVRLDVSIKNPDSRGCERRSLSDPGVCSEQHCFVLIVDISPFENFIDLTQFVFHRDFVRKIRGEHASLRTDSIEAREQSRGGQSQTVSTHSPSRINSSAVMSGQRSWRAVATMALSAGSRIAASDTDSSKTSNV